MPARHVLITGASRGIGAALAEHCLAAGDCVVGCGRTPSTLSHERYLHCTLDVTDSDAVEGLFRDLKRRFKTLDVLINNAGVAGMNAIALTPVGAARRMVETNFLAPFNFTREALRLMRGSGAARIVNVSTVAVPLRLEGEAVYAATKSALETFTRIAVFLAHMPVFFALNPVLVAAHLGFAARVIVQLIVCLGALSVASEGLRSVVRPDRLRARVFEALNNRLSLVGSVGARSAESVS